MLVCMARGQTYNYRYWIDNSVGGAVSGSASGEKQLNVSLSSLSNGLHALHVQASNASGVWSSVRTRYFLKEQEDVECTSARYWLDNDMTTLHNNVATSGAIELDISTLNVGLHTVHYQTFATDGTPSSVRTRYFYVDREQVGNITASISIDDGDATDYALTGEDLVLEIGELPIGQHTLHVTLTDDKGNNYGTQESTFIVYNAVESVEIAMNAGADKPRSMIGYSSKYGLDFTNVQDVKAYIIMGYSDGMDEVLAVRVKIVPPYTGLMIKTDNPGVVVNVPTTIDRYYYSNLLKPVVETQTIYPTETINGEEYINFMVGTLAGTDKMGFVRLKNAVERQNKSYLPVLSSFYNITAGARQTDGFGIEFIDSESTDVRSLLRDGQLSDDAYYDLQGRKVKPVSKGLYIRNGKKVFVR